MNTTEFLYIATAICPDRPFIVFEGQQWSFVQFNERVNRLANAFRELGIQKGDRIVLHLPNCPPYIIAYYAALKLGAVVVNLNPMYTVDELKALTSDTGVSTLFTFDLVLPNIRPLCQEVDIARVVVTRVTDYIEGFGQSTPHELELEEGWHHFSLLLENASSTRLLRIDILQDDPALIQFTGGTTPFDFTRNWKFTILNNENVWAKAMNRVVSEKVPVDKAVDELIARLKQIAG